MDDAIDPALKICGEACHPLRNNFKKRVLRLPFDFAQGRSE
jgi:hypothetical protein